MLFRAWSHWRALYGAKHLELLAKHDLIDPVAEPKLGRVYEGAQSSPLASGNAEAASESNTKDVMLLDHSASKKIADDFGVPELQVEIERAIEQVEKSLGKEEEPKPEEQQDKEKKA
jgi:hypothetical protein